MSAQLRPRVLRHGGEQSMLSHLPTCIPRGVEKLAESNNLHVDISRPLSQGSLFSFALLFLVNAPSGANTGKACYTRRKSQRFGLLAGLGVEERATLRIHQCDWAGVQTFLRSNQERHQQETFQDRGRSLASIFIKEDTGERRPERSELFSFCIANPEKAEHDCREATDEAAGVLVITPFGLLPIQTGSKEINHRFQPLVSLVAALLFPILLEIGYGGRGRCVPERCLDLLGESNGAKFEKGLSCGAGSLRANAREGGVQGRQLLRVEEGRVDDGVAMDDWNDRSGPDEPSRRELQDHPRQFRPEKLCLGRFRGLRIHERQDAAFGQHWCARKAASDPLEGFEVLLAVELVVPVIFILVAVGFLLRRSETMVRFRVCLCDQAPSIPGLEYGLVSHLEVEALRMLRLHRGERWARVPPSDKAKVDELVVREAERG
mmetsp:Transcript_12623/g.31028  ORF Transcript_12623/g.31028 Transcript_12623/m.31028 type:complete len:434 (+) Transcript_12623:470-1771(+)